jgi:endonuclease V-like protein UPF0215 family
MSTFRPHVFGVDDAPFEKGQSRPVPIIGVMMESADLVESVAVGEFPVDGGLATEFLFEWVTGLRSYASLQGIVLGGITIAGLGVVDIEELARRAERPILVVTRRRPTNAQLVDALRAAGFEERIAIVERSPRASRISDGLYVAHAGADVASAARMVRATVGKAQLPEPLRIAHLMGRAIVIGESRGRV